MQRADLELAPPRKPLAIRSPPPRACLQHCDRFVHPAQQRVSLLKHLHRHVRMAVFGLEQLLGVDEVRVRVVAVADPLNRQPEDRGVEAGNYLRRHSSTGSNRGTAWAAMPAPDPAEESFEPPPDPADAATCVCMRAVYWGSSSRTDDVTPSAASRRASARRGRARRPAMPA